jgi:hypothetical protein
MMGFGLLMVLGVFIVPILLIAWLVFWIAQPRNAASGPQTRVLGASGISASAAHPCTHCGASLQAEWAHCPQCGAPA